MSLELYVLVILLALGIAVQAALVEYSRSRLEKYCMQRNSTLLGKVFLHDDNAEMAFRFWNWTVIAAFAYSYLLPVMQQPHNTWQLAGSLLILALGLCVLDQWISWPIGKVLAVQIIYWGWPLINVIRLLYSPVVLGANFSNFLVLRLAGEPDNGRGSPIQDEILTVVNEGEREGAINQDAADMIEGLMELHEFTVSEIMTPRTDMVMIRDTDTIQEACRVINEAGHSRVPVYAKTRDDVRGILYAKDLLPHLEEKSGAERQLASVKLREPVYVPEDKAVNILLREFQKERVHIAIVLDEYGGVAGLVTIEDIIEEIVGEIDDEYDPAHKPRVRVIDENTIEVDARVHVDEVNELIAVDLPEDADYDTVGGFVFSELGRVPKVGENLQHMRALITVLDATDRTIDRIRIELQTSNELESIEPSNASESSG